MSVMRFQRCFCQPR